jgi:hypothetical protein
MMDKDGWILLENFPTLIAAEMAKSRLASDGIDSEIFDGEMASLYTSALGGVQLMVQAEDKGRARDILESESIVEDEVVSEADEITPSSVYCSQCHSKDIESKSLDSVQPGLSLVKTLKKWLGFKKILRCLNCGNTWMG